MQKNMTDKKSKILDIRQCGETISAAGNFSGKTKSDVSETTGKMPEKSVNSEKNCKEETKENYIQSKAVDFLDILIEYLLRLLIFVLPIFVLPFSVEVYEFNKTLLLFIVSSLAFLIWIAKMVLIEREIKIARTPLDFPIIIFTIAIVFSTVFSVDKVSSILGFYGRFSDSLIVYLSLAMLYFSGVNCIIARSHSGIENRRVRNITDGFIGTFLVSALIMIIAGMIYFLGFKFIPWPEAQFRSFNLAGGSPNIFAVYLVSVILISLYYRGRALNVLSKYLPYILILPSILLLAVIDFISAWIVLFVSLILYFALIFIINRMKNIIAAQNDSKTKNLILPFLLIFVSFVFVATSLSVSNKGEKSFSSSAISTFIKDKLTRSDSNQVEANSGFTKEIILDKDVAFSVALNSLKIGSPSAIVGSGPGTYLYDFSKFKPAEFNNNNLWYVRFDKAGSEILEKFSTIGIAGASSYLLIIIFAVLMFLKAIKSAGNKDFVYLFSAWFCLLFFQFLYLESTATKFVFWLLTVFAAGQYCLRAKYKIRRIRFNLKTNKQAFIISVTIFLLLSSLFAISYYFKLKFYQSEMIYKKEVAKQNEDKDINNLNEIIRLNPYRGDYEAYLSSVYLFRGGKDLMNKDKTDGNQNDVDKITSEIKSAIDHAKKAVELEPNNVIFQQNLGSVYAILARDFAVGGADEWAIKAYGKAIELEPTNPVLRIESGKIRLLKYFQSKSENDIGEAINEFEKALGLKSDYLPAGLQLGLAYEAAGDNQKAISQLSNYSSSGDAEIIFQLGKIYFNTGETDKAKNLFLEALKINPKNSNTHYGLGLVYKKEGDLSKALEEFNLVLSMNPGNADVMGKIDEINAVIKKTENVNEAGNSEKNNISEQ